MRQDLRQRERQIRKLHDSIDKYQQSPNTKKAVENAAIELANGIEYKFRKSEANKNYVFPRTCPISDDEYDSGSEVVDLKVQADFLSQDLSIAEEPESNVVYISEKTVMMQDKYSPFSKSRPEARSRLKIKVVKKKNPQVYETSKLDRLRTEHIHANFSTISYKNETHSRGRQNQSTSSKSRLIHPLNSDSSGIRKKLKIATRMDTDHSSSNLNANLTMKTEYVHSTRRKAGKENERPTMNPHQSQKYYIAHQTSTKKLQASSSKFFLNVRCSMKKPKEVQRTQITLDNNKKKKVCHKSFESLKSIRLGYTKSTQKVKMGKGLLA